MTTAKKRTSGAKNGAGGNAVATPAGFVRTPAGDLISEADIRSMTTELRPPQPPPFAERDAARERARIEASVMAEAFLEAPIARRAAILAAELRAAAARIDDPEYPVDKKAELEGAVERAWIGFGGVQRDANRKWRELLEHVEVVAFSSGTPQNVIDGFARAYPDDARKLPIELLQQVLAAWCPPVGRPSRTRPPAVPGQAKWDLFAKLCSKLGWSPPAAATIEDEWSRARPAWLTSFRDRMRKTRGRRTS